MNAQRVVVMGLGNLLWADEGFGIRVAERLYARYHWPEEVEIVDGGTQGLNLLGYVEQASHLLLLDAIDYGRRRAACEPMPARKSPRISAPKNEPASKQFFRSSGAGRHPRASALSHCAGRPATGATGRLRR